MTSRFTYSPVCRAVQLSPKEGSADLLNFIASLLNFIASLLNFIASHLNLNASVVFVSVCILLFDVHVFQCRSHPRNNRSCQFRAACRSCVGNRCPELQFCLQKLSNHLAEAVHSFVDVCQFQPFWIFMSCDSSSCDVHVTVLDLMSTVVTCN